MVVLLCYATLSLTFALILGRGKEHVCSHCHERRGHEALYPTNAVKGDVVRRSRRSTSSWRSTARSQFRRSATSGVHVIEENDQKSVSTRDRYDNLFSWLRTKGAIISPKLSIEPSMRIGGGYGAFLSHAAEAGEVLFVIPREACITLSDALNDDSCGRSFKQLIEKAGPGATTVVMAGYLARERMKALHDEKLYDSSSPTEFREGRLSRNALRYAPYLETLPWSRGINNQEHVLFWSDCEIAQYLKGTMCYSEAVSLRQEVQLAISILNRIIGKSVREYRGEMGGALSSDSSEFKWPWQIWKEKSEEAALQNEVADGLPEAVTGAFVCLLTRSFHEDIEGSGEESEKLVPLLDMLQHSDVPNVSHFTKEEPGDAGDVVVVARRPIEAGEELLNQYRPELEESMPYHRFFSRFGFVPGIEEPITNLLQDKSPIFVAQSSEV